MFRKWQMFTDHKSVVFIMGILPTSSKRNCLPLNISIVLKVALSTNQWIYQYPCSQQCKKPVPYSKLLKDQKSQMLRFLFIRSLQIFDSYFIHNISTILLFQYANKWKLWTQLIKSKNNVSVYQRHVREVRVLHIIQPWYIVIFEKTI